MLQFVWLRVDHGELAAPGLAVGLRTCSSKAMDSTSGRGSICCRVQMSSCSDRATSAASPMHQQRPPFLRSGACGAPLLWQEARQEPAWPDILPIYLKKKVGGISRMRFSVFYFLVPVEERPPHGCGLGSQAGDLL